LHEPIDQVEITFTDDEETGSCIDANNAGDVVSLIHGIPALQGLSYPTMLVRVNGPSVIQDLLVLAIRPLYRNFLALGNLDEAAC
jgi:hypothetical protein